MYVSNIKRVPLLKPRSNPLMARSSQYALILGEMQCVAFRLMLSLCVCVCVCLCVCMSRLWTPGKQALNSDSKFKFGILFSTCSNSKGVK